MSNNVRIHELLGYIQEGRIMDAMNEFYADDVVMEEPMYGTTSGLAANLEREQKFVDSVKEFRGFEAKNVSVGENSAAYENVMDWVDVSGQEMHVEQVAVLGEDLGVLAGVAGHGVPGRAIEPVNAALLCHGKNIRVGLARDAAKFIVADESVAALDVSIQADVLNLIKQIQSEMGLTFMFISHDLTVVRHMADRIGVLYLGQLVEEADPETLFDDPKHPYTQMLLAAAPKMDGFGREVEPPKGEIPDPISPPPGCAFHPRCDRAEARCRQVEQELDQARRVS